MELKNREVRIENTSVCNAHCTICPRENFTRRVTTMPMYHFEKLATQAWDMGAETISIFGYGEPLCDPKIVEKVELCHALGMDTFITTNGSLLHTDLASRLLRAGISHIRFSGHGLYKTYDAVHRGLNFETYLRNLSNFIKMNDGGRHVDDRAEVSVSVIPMHNEPLEWIIEFYQPGKWVDYLEVWKPHNWTDGKEYRQSTIKRKKTCGRPFNGPVQINADGTIMVCCFDYNGEMTVGDTYYQSIAKILSGDGFNEIRQKHRTGDLSGLPCATCDQLNIGDDNPLLYSNRDPERKINCTSSTKFALEEQ